MKKFAPIVCIILIYIMPSQVAAQTFDCYDGRYKMHVFTDYEVQEDVVYARKKKSNGVWQNLVYDVYTPMGDSLVNRPAVFLAHGGSYIDIFDQRSPDIVRMAQDLVLRGYVVFSVEYREEPSITAVFSEKQLVGAIAHAIADTRDVTCSIMDTTFLHGNPFGIDPERIFIGGTSAGSVNYINYIFLDSISWLSDDYQEWVDEAEPNMQALLDNRYCGANILGVINVSGATLDTAWIKDYKADEYPAFIHIHGTADNIIPYNIGKPFGIPWLPELSGSAVIHEKLIEIGTRSELHAWQGSGHIPFLGFELQELFGPNPIDVFFNQSVLLTTLEQISEFNYSLIDCNELESELPTSTNNFQVEQLNMYPNPSTGYVTVKIPISLKEDQGLLEVFDMTGKLIDTRFIVGDNNYTYNHLLESGHYIVKLSFNNRESKSLYFGQLLVQK